MTALILVTAVALDWLLGEPQRWHPLTLIGHLAKWLESKLYPAKSSPSVTVLWGGIAVLLLVLPSGGFVYWVSLQHWCFFWFDLALVTLCIGHRSLYDHVVPIVSALQQHDEASARTLTARIVSRDADQLNVVNAATESVLENGNDAVFAALFWFAVAGPTGIVIYRIINTLDAMWGYRSPRYLYFGRIAARLDDVMNYIPARLTALSYALLGQTKTALLCWHQQAPHWGSPNAGPVMASGAGALNVTLGGPACYQGEWHQRPQLGSGPQPESQTILQALHLVSRSVLLWLVIISLINGISYA